MLRRFIVLAVFPALLAGCSPQKEEVSSSTTKTKPTLSQAALTRLEEADRLDGATDHVIGKCYVCSLGMDGSEKFAVKVDGYTAHLCSRLCKEEFEKSAEEIVMKTEVPKGAAKE